MDIFNNNKKNNPDQATYDAFNAFIFADDIKVLGKLLHRHKFYEQVAHLPGDIVELGVFKGSGVATFAKFIEIFQPNSNKKVIGFDLFDANNDIVDKYKNGEQMQRVYNRVQNSELSLNTITEHLQGMKIDESKYILVQGDVAVTTKSFIQENPGFRIALLYLDLDLDEPCYHALNNMWERILPGGIVVFDEYEYHKFDESNGVDRFLREQKLDYEIISTNWFAPTAYLLKKRF